jgi:hypothetical protein
MHVLNPGLAPHQVTIDGCAAAVGTTVVGVTDAADADQVEASPSSLSCGGSTSTHKRRRDPIALCDTLLNVAEPPGASPTVTPATADGSE